MLSDSSDDLVLYAPISNDTRYVEFKIHHKSRSLPASSWSLIRTVIASVPEVREKFIVGFPVGARYQETPPPFLRNLTVIDSRSLGAGRLTQEQGDVYFDLLSPLLREMGVGHVYVATDSARSIAENAASFSSSGTVVILGGDTSAHEFINALQPLHSESTCEMRLVVVPVGTGNALASSVGLMSPLAAVQRLFLASSCDFVPLSTFPVQFPGESIPLQYALVVASWGFHSALVADSDTPELRQAYRSDPSGRFKEAARLNLETLQQTYEGEVSGGAQYGPRHSYLLFTTVTHLEASFCISPHSHPPSSKKLHMVAIEPFESIEEQKSQLMGIMMKVYDNADHLKDSRVTYTLVDGDVYVDVKDQPSGNRRWCIDGKIIVSPVGSVCIKEPTHICKGWQLKVLPGNRSDMRLPKTFS